MSAYKPYTGPGYQRFLEECLKQCDCCVYCQDAPCGGVMAGGLCDQMPCRCDEDPWDGEWEEDEHE